MVIIRIFYELKQFIVHRIMYLIRITVLYIMLLYVTVKCFRPLPVYYLLRTHCCCTLDCGGVTMAN